MARCIRSSSLGTVPNTYLYALSRAPDGASLATIASDDSLRLFSGNLDVLAVATRCHVGITSLAPGGPASFVTAARDGVVRSWNSQGRKVAEFAEPHGRAISSVTCYGNYIAAGTESSKEGLGDVSVLLFDARNSSTPVLRQYDESHTDTITQLQFCPSQPHFLLSGSTDGLISIFDVNHADEDDALQQVLNPRSAVHCAGFFAPDLAYGISTDEQYTLFPLAKTTAEDEVVPPPVAFGDVREHLQCAYVIDVLLQSDGPPLMAYGDHGRQTMSVVSLGQPGAWTFGQRLEFPAAHGDELVRGILVDGQSAYTCGEDGTVKAWKLPS